AGGRATPRRRGRGAGARKARCSAGGHAGPWGPQHRAAGPVQAAAVSGSAAFAGVLVRIRWSKALSDALAPSPIAATICLYGVVVASPAANTPGSEVRPAWSTSISPRGDSSTVPLSHSALGSRPIGTNTHPRSDRPGLPA